jgi:transposase InsO family protein
VFDKQCGRGTKAGPPVHDDLVRRDFTATCANRLWLADITEYATGEGKLYLCVIKDAFSTRIVGYSIDARMKSRLGQRPGPEWKRRRMHSAQRSRIAVPLRKSSGLGQPPDGRFDRAGRSCRG